MLSMLSVNVAVLRGLEEMAGGVGRKAALENKDKHGAEGGLDLLCFQGFAFLEINIF